jgi:hypothetical protein
VVSVAGVLDVLPEGRSLEGIDLLRVPDIDTVQSPVAGLSAVFFLVCLARGEDAVFREQASLVPVMVVSIIDIADLINSKSRIRDFLMGLLRSAGPSPKRVRPSS